MSAERKLLCVAPFHSARASQSPLRMYDVSPPGQFFFQQSADNADHIRIAVKMLRFIKRIIANASDLAKMREMNARSELANHGEQIIVGARSIRADAKGEAIRGRVGACKEGSSIISGGNHARDAKERLRWIVGRVPVACDRAVTVDGLRLGTALHRGGLPRWLPEAVQQQRGEDPEDEDPGRDQDRVDERAHVGEL